MDGGWFFPIDVQISTLDNVADSSSSLEMVKDWISKNNITSGYYVGRDMGEVPPQQTEFRFKVPGQTFTKQMEVALTAYDAFGFPTIAEEIVSVFKSANPTSLNMSIIITAKGFVRLSLFIPDPSNDLVESLCTLSGGNLTQMLNFQKLINLKPKFAEYQYLMKGFGYGVYKEGFDVMFHYKLE